MACGGGRQTKITRGRRNTFQLDGFYEDRQLVQQGAPPADLIRFSGFQTQDRVLSESLELEKILNALRIQDVGGLVATDTLS